MIHPRITLVTVADVATQRGIPDAAVYDLVDGGFGDNSLLWVFNVATRLDTRRELRFWSREQTAPETTRTLALDAVVKQIVPRRDAVPGQFCGLRNWEVGELLRLSKSSLLELREELKAVPHNGGIYVPREALENFFKRRWCYANVRQPIQTKLI